MGLGTDPEGPGERSRRAWGETPSGPGERPPLGLGRDPRWAWGQILMGLGEDPDRPGERPPVGLGDGTACWSPCLAPTHSELLNLLGSSPCSSRPRRSHRPHHAFPPLPPTTLLQPHGPPHCPSPTPGPVLPPGLCTGCALSLEHCVATSATGPCPVSRYPLMCSGPPGVFHHLWMSACLPSRAELSTLVSFYSDPPCGQGRAASPIKGQMAQP